MLAAEPRDLWASGDENYVCTVLDGLARLAIADSRPEQAARILGVAAAQREVVNAPVVPSAQAAYASTITAATMVLGDAAFAAAWAAGRALSLERAVAEALAPPGSPTPADHSDPPGTAQSDLTIREREVLRFLVEGHSDREIAELLSISSRTVSHHVAAILGRLGLESRTAAATFAVRHGLV